MRRGPPGTAGSGAATDGIRDAARPWATSNSIVVRMKRPAFAGSAAFLPEIGGSTIESLMSIPSCKVSRQFYLHDGFIEDGNIRTSSIHRKKADSNALEAKGAVRKVILRLHDTIVIIL